ncbi:MAG TPA: methyltransferase domain-containing protein [Candidatus Binatia bacterium]|jgi:SAM-dependent methyltransferase|nr:methyltransferase domain-containing protein [Candidatus Binatia bacterium]
MRVESLQYLICPICRVPLNLADTQEIDKQGVKEGNLVCQAERHSFAVRDFIPRFYTEDDASSSFGFEWQQHTRTQLDSVNGMRLSEERFYRQTRWKKDLSGEKILEIGSGAGRFTEIALKTGALVFSIDASRAVDVNWANNGRAPNLVLCQASLYRLPFPESYFDKVFCFGVLQHTPDVARAFASIAKFTKPGGELAVDVYNREFWRNYHAPEYLIRPLTKRIPHPRLYRGIRWLVPRLLPVSTWLLNHIPRVGRQLSALIPISNYHGLLPTDSKSIIREYSILDTFDTVASKFISTQYPEAVRRWFLESEYEAVEGDRNTVFSMRGRRKLQPPDAFHETAHSSAELGL